MFNLISADLFKIRKSSVFKFILAISVLSAVIMTIIAHLIAVGKLDKSISSFGFLFSDANVLSILGAVVSGIFICSDFDNKTIHDAISTGCSRYTIIVSKAVSFFIAVIIIELPYIIVTAIAIGTGGKFNIGSVGVGFLHLLTSTSESALSASKIPKLILIILALIIMYLAALSVCVLLAIAFKKSVAVVAVYYAISILTAQLGSIEESYKFLKNVLSFTPYSISCSLMNLNTSTNDIIKSIAANLVFIIIIIGITSFSFRKTEIK